MNYRGLPLINKDFITLIVVLIFSLIIFFSNETKYVNRIESIIIDSISKIMYPKSWYKDILLVKEENKSLKQEVTQLSLYNAKLNNYKIENDKLRKMLSFKEAYDKISILPCNVVNHSFSSSPNSIIVDVGNNDGIFLNQAVIDMHGLVGKTISKGAIASKVQVITDQNFAVSVKIGLDLQIAIFKPTHGKYGLLEGVIKSSKLNVGDIIYTSGISEIYPSDIPVCKIVSLTDDNDKAFLNVVVEILADLTNLNYVFVIQ